MLMTDVRQNAPLIHFSHAMSPNLLAAIAYGSVGGFVYGLTLLLPSTAAAVSVLTNPAINRSMPFVFLLVPQLLLLVVGLLTTLWLYGSRPVTYTATERWQMGTALGLMFGMVAYVFNVGNLSGIFSMRHYIGTLMGVNNVPDDVATTLSFAATTRYFVETHIMLLLTVLVVPLLGAGLARFLLRLHTEGEQQPAPKVLDSFWMWLAFWLLPALFITLLFYIIVYINIYYSPFLLEMDTSVLVAMLRILPIITIGIIWLVTAGLIAVARHPQVQFDNLAGKLLSELLLVQIVILNIVLYFLLFIYQLGSIWTNLAQVLTTCLMTYLALAIRVNARRLNFQPHTAPSFAKRFTAAFVALFIACLTLFFVVVQAIQFLVLVLVDLTDSIVSVRLIVDIVAELSYVGVQYRLILLALLLTIGSAVVLVFTVQVWNGTRNTALKFVLKCERCRKPIVGEWAYCVRCGHEVRQSAAYHESSPSQPNVYIEDMKWLLRQLKARRHIFIPAVIFVVSISAGLGFAFLTVKTPAQVDVDGISTVAPRPTSPPTATPMPVAEVIVAVQDLPAGITIQPNMVEVVAYPFDVLPPNTLNDMRMVMGSIVLEYIPRSQLITSDAIAFDYVLAEGLGGNLHPTMPQGRIRIAQTVTDVFVPGDISQEWIIQLAADETYQIELVVDAESDFQPVIFVWQTETGAELAIDTTLSIDGRHISGTISPPITGDYSIIITDAAFPSGDTSGRYTLRVTREQAP